PRRHVPRVPGTGPPLVPASEAAPRADHAAARGPRGRVRVGSADDRRDVSRRLRGGAERDRSAAVLGCSRAARRPDTRRAACAVRRAPRAAQRSRAPRRRDAARPRARHSCAARRRRRRPRTGRACVARPRRGRRRAVRGARQRPGAAGILPARGRRLLAGGRRRELRTGPRRSHGRGAAGGRHLHRRLSRPRRRSRAAGAACRSGRAGRRAGTAALRRRPAAGSRRARAIVRVGVRLAGRRPPARGDLLRCAEPLMFLANFLVALASTLAFKLALFVYAAGGEGQTSAIAWYPRLALCLGWDVVSALIVGVVARAVAAPMQRHRRASLVAAAVVQAAYGIFLVVSYHIAVIVGAPLDKAAIDLWFFYADPSPGGTQRLFADSVAPYFTPLFFVQTAAAIVGPILLLRWVARHRGGIGLGRRSIAALALAAALTIVAVPGLANGIFA